MKAFSYFIITLLVPLALVGTAVRLIMTPLFLEMEYRMPGFPPDPYGFTLEERLSYGKLTLHYLVSNKTIDYFSSLKLKDGKPLYNDLELSHMNDVHKLIIMALWLWKIALLLLLALAFLAWRHESMYTYMIALRRGAWLTLGIVGAIVLLSAIAFNLFFDFFHRLLFNPGTWTFYESDTFIRLFPERFWQDVFLWAGLIIALQFLTIFFITRKKLRLTLK